MSYFCAMHADVRQEGPGKCPKCGMDLMPEGARFGMLRHITKSPLMLAVMAAIMVVVIALLMMPR